ncbi:inter-alpha-trypsin inhibitor heavy chain H3-like isoform X5 [Biomphalaria glabrata]|uniref:Inter-alpha-trypsin inhibitor heavy chain H3-like isoform X5 n=1 Tax=Biomphalaria glabrata TaxID=6526 RepID=A0A9U8EDS2_BIOGL|nr:inter-alpha-trypsin inhibitor heavy chain H3-like isoform X5 [Biomphalaria glabrata]
MAYRNNWSSTYLVVFVTLYTLINVYCVLGDRETKVIESYHVKSDIRFRFATTQMSSVVRNKAEMAQEIAFDVALPEEAFIVSFSMFIDGKNYDGEVKEKAKAKEEYQSAVNMGQSAGLISQAPRHSNTFTVSVNVAAGSAVNFTLVYQELLQRKHGMYEYEINVKPGQAVEDFLIEVYIQETSKLKFVKTPALRNDSLVYNTVEVQNVLIVEERPTPETSHIVFKPNIKQQGDKGISAQFVVQYDVEHKPKGEILVVDGYFIHFFAPDLPPIPKDILFVLDVSSSMYGNKINQLKTAISVILKDLQPQDRFNIIKFSSGVTKWRDELVSVEEGTIKEAQYFVQQLSASGMTNINDALLTAVNDLKVTRSKHRVSMIFFLTDGSPTMGEMNKDKIAANVAGFSFPIFGLAFGHEADFNLMKTISIQSFGFARKIYEASDAALQVSGLYKEISAVSIKDATISYLPSIVDELTVTENNFPVIFKDSEVVVSGKLAQNTKNMEIVIKGIQQSGEISLVLNEVDYNSFILKDNVNPFFTLPRDFSGIVEKMWAFITIKQLLKEKEKNSSAMEEIDKKIIQMSLKYKFVTPLTAMIVKKPNEENPSVSSLEAGDHRFMSPDALSQMQGGYLQPISSRLMFSRAHAHVIPPMGPNGDRGLRPTSFPVGWDPPVGNLVEKTAKKMNKKKTGTDKSNRQFTDNPLPVFTVHSGKFSLCLVPKKLNLGTYRLLTLSNGTFVDLGLVCGKKQCSLSSKQTMSTGKQNVTLNLVNKEVAGWNFTASWHFGVYNTSDVLNINGEGISIKLSWNVNGVSKYYNLEIKVDPSQKYTGLVGDLLNPSAKEMKKLKKGRHSACKNVQYSKVIKNKMARKYFQKS